MQEQLKAVTSTLTVMQRVSKLTDQYMAQIRELGERTNAQAKALYQQHQSGELDYDEYNQRLNLIEEVQRVEGERIEKAHVAACRGNSGH